MSFFINKIMRHASFLLCLIFATSAGAQESIIKNIVLVHGAFTDGSSWSAVTALLQAKGYNVTAVQNPLTSLNDDVAATERVLQRQHGDVLLVGHSWGGAVITQAGNAENVKGLVYLSALVPDSGESVTDTLTRLNAPMSGMQPDNNGLIWLDNPEIFQNVMANDLPEPQARLLAAAQQPIAAKAFNEKVNHAAWRNKPSWYLVTENDNALNPAVQNLLAREAGANITHLPSSHMSMVSHPKDVAALIDKAAHNLKQ
ncbi:alpha/beta hydrolase [Phytobacter diazotrophicus]|uniref:alpha/beta hydrolase n=1 Tax=Phytobacter diazotrophicus TaxID=395631 RepID=UPI000D16946A|nr:alpha/beta hydrolase [Phytobacter diazotrophicus]MDV2900291.1 alpha/beta hydrolase [Phytobacter diazotrophicus]PTA96947.1 alpha/beta hydrolase [Kluyvera sp. Nf5]